MLREKNQRERRRRRFFSLCLFCAFTVCRAARCICAQCTVQYSLVFNQSLGIIFRYTHLTATTIAIKIREITSYHTCCIFKVLKSIRLFVCTPCTHCMCQLVERKYSIFGGARTKRPCVRVHCTSIQFISFHIHLTLNQWQR